MTQFVEIDERIDRLESVEHRVWSTPAGRGGIIGASAAIAWKGSHDFTWECTAWRHAEGERIVPPQLVDEMSTRFPSTFLNRDPNANRSLIAPRTPCPVLYGIRGESKQGVLEAHDFLQKNGSEICKDFRAYRSNQATDDHLGPAMFGRVKTVRILQGGHVEIECDQKLLCFAQGGDVNRLSQELRAGDEIEWFGLSDTAGNIHLERLRLVSGVRNKVRPICTCGTRYKSKGQNQPLRCPNCGSRHADEWKSEQINSDWKEPPASHRRHLAKPLTRRGKSEV